VHSDTSRRSPVAPAGLALGVLAVKALPETRRGHRRWARWLCMVSRGWVWQFFGWWHHGDGTHAVMVARAVPACILAQADTTN